MGLHADSLSPPQLSPFPAWDGDLYINRLHRKYIQTNIKPTSMLPREPEILEDICVHDSIQVALE